MGCTVSTYYKKGTRNLEKVPQKYPAISGLSHPIYNRRYTSIVFETMNISTRGITEGLASLRPQKRLRLKIHPPNRSAVPHLRQHLKPEILMDIECIIDMDLTALRTCPVSSYGPERVKAPLFITTDL
jgi:hypothetical protein